MLRDGDMLRADCLPSMWDTLGLIIRNTPPQSSPASHNPKNQYLSFELDTNSPRKWRQEECLRSKIKINLNSKVKLHPFPPPKI